MDAEYEYTTFSHLKDLVEIGSRAGLTDEAAVIIRVHDVSGFQENVFQAAISIDLEQDVIYIDHQW